MGPALLFADELDVPLLALAVVEGIVLTHLGGFFCFPGWDDWGKGGFDDETGSSEEFEDVRFGSTKT